MSQERRTLIHCGATRVSFLEVLVNEGNQVLVEDLATEILEYGFVDDSAWMEATVAGIQKLVASRKGKINPTILVPGFRILSKNLRIPHVEESKRKQIIAFELQQNLPYSMEEVVWDFQVVADDGIETDILFLASKREWVEAFCERLESLNIQPASLGPASLLDYNAWQFLEGEDDLPVLVVNLGARSTTLTFIHEGGFALRTVNFGGNLLTQPIADHLGCSFHQAESLKIRFFTEEESFGDEDPRVRMIHDQADQFRKRLNLEITRSLMQFRRQTEGSAPRALRLAGGGALLPGLESYLSEQQKVPARLFQMEDMVLPAPTVDAGLWAAIRYQVFEIVGEAVKDRVPRGVGVDLIPPAIHRQKAFNRKKPRLVAAGLLVSLTAFFPGLHYQSRGQVLKGEVAALQQTIGATEQMIFSQSEILEQLEVRREAIEILDRPLSSRSNWLSFFQQLQENLHNVGDVWLDELEVSRQTQVVEAAIREEPTYDEYGERIVPKPVERTLYRLNLSGKMLLRESNAEGDSPLGKDYDEQVISSRIRSMIAEFQKSDFIEDSGVPTIFWTRLEDGILPFSFNLTVSPEKPL